MEVRAKQVPNDLPVEGWTVSNRASSKQRGSDDCGVFLLMVGREYCYIIECLDYILMSECGSHMLNSLIKKLPVWFQIQCASVKREKLYARLVTKNKNACMLSECRVPHQKCGASCHAPMPLPDVQEICEGSTSKTFEEEQLSPL